MSAQTNTESVSKRKKTSWIWQHFKEDEIEENGIKISIIKCQEKNDDGEPCDKSYKNSGSSTGNAIHHLSSAHNLFKDETKKNDMVNKETKSKKEKHSKGRQKQLRQFLVSWIINDSQPIRVVKSSDLKILFKELDPAFIMPCQETIRDMIYEAFNHTLPQLKTLIKDEAMSISLTLDLWTSRSRQGYLGITCSFIDPKWKLKEFTLTIEYVRYPHTATHILETLELVLKEWNIRDKVYTITTDNGSNVKKAISDMKNVKWLGCVAHTLHLVVGKGMMPAQILIMRAKRLIDFFMRPKQSERLEDIQKQFPDIDKINEKEGENKDEGEELDAGKTADYLHAIADVTTRWNSSYLAWQRLLKLKNYIYMLINSLSTKTDPDFKKDYKRLKQIMLEEDEWDVIKDLMPVLKPFAEATDYLGGNKYCTYSLMVPTLLEIIKRFKPLTENGEKNASEVNFRNQEHAFDDQISIEDDDEEISIPTAAKKLKIKDPVDTQNLVNRIKLTLYAAMKHYWSNLITPEFLLPSLFDPRIKELSFVPVSQRFDTEELLNDLYDQEKESLSNSSDSVQVDLMEKQISKKYDSIFASFRKPITSSTNEVTEYLTLKEINFESDPLVWWFEQEKRFPILSKLAKKYLAVYSCSTSSERLFSDAGNLLTAKRNQTSPLLFKKIMFLKRNSIHLESIHP